MAWITPAKPRRRVYEYTVFGEDERYEVNSNFVPDSGEWIAEEAAEDFFHNHDGWDWSWPMSFTIYHEDESLGSFSVDMESVPQFSALKLVV